MAARYSPPGRPRLPAREVGRSSLEAPDAHDSVTALRYARRALEDLERLADLVIDASPAVASATFALIESALVVLERHPLIGRPAAPATLRFTAMTKCATKRWCSRSGTSGRQISRRRADARSTPPTLQTWGGAVDRPMRPFGRPGSNGSSSPYT